jgi:hypothetical protein
MELGRWNVSTRPTRAGRCGIKEHAVCLLVCTTWTIWYKWCVCLHHAWYKFNTSVINVSVKRFTFIVTCENTDKVCLQVLRKLLQH